MTKWTKQYNNDTGPNDDYFEEWFEVTDGRRIFRCEESEDADFLLSVLAQPEQEPVALKHRLVKIHDALSNKLGDTDPYIDEDMTDEQICEEMPVFWAAKEIADLVRDAPWSNYTPPQPKEPEQEPVAAAKKDEVFAASIEFIGTLAGMTPPPIETAPPEVFKPFYDFTEKVCSILATPPQRTWVGLTDEEMHACWDSPLTPFGMKHVRMIEAKLKEKNT